jgi:hypothetical protein
MAIREGSPQGQPVRPPKAPPPRPCPRGHWSLPLQPAHPRKRTFTPMMGLSHREYRAPGTGPISRDLSPYIVPDGIESVLQGGGKSRIHRVRSHRFTGIYRTMQFNNAVQDTERVSRIDSQGARSAASKFARD